MNSPGQPLRKDRNLYLIFAVTLSAVMGISLVTPIFPRIVEIFGIQRGQATLLITVFTLPGFFLSPLYGILADRWGRKRVLVPLLMLFGITGGICGVVRDFNLLLILRFLQGVGGGGLFTLNHTIIGDLYKGRNRLRAIGLNASLISIASAMYPAIGGFMARWHWSVPFYLPAVAIPVGLAVMTMLNNPESIHSQALKGYLSGLWRNVISPRVIRLFIISIIPFILVMGPIVSFLPFWMSERYDSGSVAIGVMLSAGSIGAATTSALLGRIRRVISVRWMITATFIGYTVSFWTIPLCPSYWWLLIPAVMFGAAQGINIPSVQMLIINEAPPQSRGMFMSINSMIILLGISSGPVLAALAVNRFGMVGMYRISGLVAMIVFGILLILGRTLGQARVDEHNVTIES